MGTFTKVAAGYLGIALGIVATLIVSAPAIHADAPEGRGTNTIETRSTGTPDNPRGFGAVTSQRALDDHDIGEHASGQTEPRLGVGNVAANDGTLFTLTGLTDTGTRPGDHAAVIGELSGYPATNRPGTRDSE